MDIVVFDSAEQSADIGAERVVEVFRDQPEGVIGLATGSSPQPLYAALAAQVRDGADFSRLRAFALDEYVGIPVDHPESYHSIIRRDVVEPLGLDASRVRVPDGLADDIDGAARVYDEAIGSAGGIDLQILGIGTNGHIGFNEPGSSLTSRTRRARLTEATRRANARFFDSYDDVPEFCVTQGIGTILDAKRLLVVANGVHKARAVAAALEGDVSAACPASALQLHPRVTVLLDAAAGSSLRSLEHYRHAGAHLISPGR